MRVACILASRSIAGIDGGTNRIGRTIFGFDQRHRQIDGAEIERAAGRGFLRRALAARTADARALS